MAILVLNIPNGDKLIFESISHWLGIIIFLDTSDIQNIVASNEDFAEIAGASAVNELLGGGQLQVHVAVGGHQKALVFVAPFELNHHGFAR